MAHDNGIYGGDESTGKGEQGAQGIGQSNVLLNVGEETRHEGGKTETQHDQAQKETRLTGVHAVEEKGDAREDEGQIEEKQQFRRHLCKGKERDQSLIAPMNR